MFSSLAKLNIDKDGFLVDDRGIIYPRGAPIKTIKFKFYAEPFVHETPASIGEYTKLEREVQTLIPKPNAWADAGIIKEGIEVLKLPDMDLTGKIYTESREVCYRVRKIEFYHLGV